MLAVEAVILALCVARICRLIIEDDILARPREAILTRWPSSDVTFGESEVTQTGTDTLGYDTGLVGDVRVVWVEGWYPTNPVALSKLLTCVWCLSFWVGCLVTLLWWLYPEATVIVSAPFAFSYVAGRTW